ncbi:MAG: hypothetical protein M1281_17060 [Chloroflexi bacterium]|nr:hypothetical protein [Chloroflexota bacterium]
MELEEREQRGQFSLAGPVDGKPGKFEILAITAGEGNGWKFGEPALQASLGLWEGVETFVDHAGWLSSSRSVRDLGGICREAIYDAQRKGIRVTLQTAGPSGTLIDSLAREWLASPEPRPRLGFSADVIFTAQGREVKQILRVLSLDLVFNPARGGAFVRALNQQKEAFNMEEPTEMELKLSEALLQAQLEGARLPAPMAASVRAQYAGKAFKPEELQSQIEAARKLVAELQGGAVIQGPGRISEMVTSEDRLQAAMDDLLEAPRDPGMEGKPVERLHGIREAYTLLTGDVDLRGGYHPEHVRLATTATMTGLVKNALNKIITRQWEELGRAGYRWWEKIVRVEHFDNLNQITGVLVGEVGLLPQVLEGAEYTELPIADVPETGDWKKYGGYLPLTLELIDRDNLAKLKAYPVKLANAALRRISGLVADVFLANGGVGPVMADGLNVFEAAGHKNLGSTALSSAEWEVVGKAIFNQEMLVSAGQTAPRLGLDPRYCLVPRDLRLTAMQLLYPNWERAATFFTENMQKGALGDVVVVPEFTESDHWAAVCDPLLAPAIYIGERFGIKPEIFIAGDPLSPAMFANDEVRLKVRHFVSIFVADYRPLYKENV